MAVPFIRRAKRIIRARGTPPAASENTYARSPVRGWQPGAVEISSCAQLMIASTMTLKPMNSPASGEGKGGEAGTFTGSIQKSENDRPAERARDHPEGQRRGHCHVNEFGAGERLDPVHVDFPWPSVSPPSVSAGSDPLRRVALFPVSGEPSHGRGNAGGARDSRDLRNRAPVGGRSLAKRFPIRSASVRLLAATNAIWMRSSSRSPASNTGFGAQSIRMASFSMSWSSRRRDNRATHRLMRKLLKSAVIPPRVMISDKLRSMALRGRRWAFASIIASNKGLNNRAENSHQPTRRRERIMKQFKSARQAQRFLSVHDKSPTSSTFLTVTPSRLTSAALRASKPLRLGARSPRRALLPDITSQKNRLSRARRSLKLTMPATVF